MGNRLTEVKSGVTYAYVYNNNGNRLDEVREGSVAGPILYKYIYDDNGNRIEKRDGADTVLQSYQYDQKNRISALTTLTDTHHFDYDPNDCRISRLDSGGTRVHLLEGEHLEAVYDGSAQLQAKYLRGVVVDEIVNGYYYDDQGKKTNYTFHHDQLRSVVALTAHEGSTVETTKYGSFGEVIDAAGTSENFLKYTGREHDEELGLYYYRARYYDPEVGRFLTEDPIGFDGGINFYAYVSNNPVNANDPMGLLVDAVYDKSKGIIIVTDRDTGTSIEALAESGGKPYGDPIPNGPWEILDQAKNPNFYRLDAVDSNPRNDIHDPTGRNYFRLHGPGATVGCIACADEATNVRRDSL